MKAVALGLGAVAVCLLIGNLAEPPLEPLEPAPAGEPPANGIVGLLTDYGSDDPYVGVIKGAVLKAAIEVRVVDLSNDAPNFDVASASYMLDRIVPEWPAGTTFVCVVDPGVGTSRRKIAALTLPDGHRFVAPDNGLLTDVLDHAEAYRVYELTNSELARPGAESSTFHGRDWFGPVGGHLAAGTPIESVGPPVGDPVLLPRTPAGIRGDQLIGTVLYVDHYGNLLTNIPTALAESAGVVNGRRVRLSIGDRAASAAVAESYGHVREGELLVTVHNAPGTLEVAVNMGHAADRLGAVAGDVLRVTVETEGGD